MGEYIPDPTLDYPYSSILRKIRLVAGGLGPNVDISEWEISLAH
jgi:hypothetical protein